MQLNRQMKRAAAGIVVAGIALIGMAAPASAANKDGFCEAAPAFFGEVCAYSEPNLQGGLLDLMNGDFDFNFSGFTNGELAANNVESALNGFPSLTARFFADPGFTGASFDIPPMTTYNTFDPAFANATESMQLL
jgi:hypothetical protein